MSGGRYGFFTYNAGANGTVSNSTFRNAVDHGAYLNAADTVSLSNNRFVNNGLSGIWLAGAASGSVIEHNLIRGNGKGGIYAASQQTVSIPVRNNLIVENTATTFAGGVYVANGASVTLQHNTIANNSATSVSGIGGVYIDQNTTVTMADNIVAHNLNSASTASDVSVHVLATPTESYNLTMDNALAGTGDLSVDPLLVKNWYLSNIAVEGTQSGAVDRVVGATTLPAYLSALTTPTTRTDGVVDTTISSDPVDMGYHHAAAAPVVASYKLKQTTVTAGPGGQTQVQKMRVVL